MSDRKARIAGTREARPEGSEEEIDRESPRGSGIAPGKQTASEKALSTTGSREQLLASKSTASEASDWMGPGAALSYAAWLGAPERGWHLPTSIDRKGDHTGAIDEESALATALPSLQASQATGALPSELIEHFTSLLGLDVACVRIHRDAAAARAAAALGAQAFTVGQDIFFAEGAFQPGSPEGLELIAHEMSHVADHLRGHAAPSTRRISRPDDAHERAADDFASRFVRERMLEKRDPAELVELVRRTGRRMQLPGLAELSEQLGSGLELVEAYTGEAARLACEAMAAGAFAVRNIVAFADPTPQREQLIHELTHVVQMGSVRAPARFARGSLQVGEADSPVEREARAGAAPKLAADASTIYRDANPSASSSNGESTGEGSPLERFREFKAHHVDKHKIDESGTKNVDNIRFGSPAGKSSKGKQIYRPRYWVSSKEPFKLQDYKDGLTGSKYDGKGKDHDLTTVYAANAKAEGLTKVGDTSSHTWAWISGEWRPFVADLREARRTKPDPVEQWKTYSAWHDALTSGEGKIFDPCLIPEGDPNGLEPNTTPGDGAAYSEGEAELFRDLLRKKIIEAPAFQMAEGQWQKFYDVIVSKDPFKQNPSLVGNIFEQLVARSLASGKSKYDATRPHFDIPGTTKDYTRTADGQIIDYQGKNIVADCKAYNVGKPTSKLPKEIEAQAQDYALIIGRGGAKIAGFDKKDGGQVNLRTFDHVVYIFPTREVSQQWMAPLRKILGEDNVSIIPAPEGVTFLYQANPTFQIDLPDSTKTHHKISNPPVIHPGMRVRELDITLKQAGSPELDSGTVLMDLDLGGALKGGEQPRPLTPAQKPGVNATLENKFKDLKSDSLQRFLSRFEVDAALTDAGVEAKVTLKKGPSGIPNFELEDSTLTVRYGGSGLAIDGHVGIRHKSGKIDGQIKVGWDGTDWSFEGTATAHEGLIDGLKSFQLKVKYAGGKWSVGCDNIEFQRKLGGVTLTGRAFGVWYDIEKGSLGGQLAIDADLGPFGKAGGEATIEDNKIKRVVLTYSSPELKYPAKSSKPALSGTLGGEVSYEEGKLQGSFHGSANLNVPGLQKFAGEGLGLAVDGQIKADGTFAGSIQTTKPLQLGKHFQVPSIACTIQDDGSVEGDFAIKIVDFMHLEDASVTCKIDRTGFHVTSANLRVPFGAEGEKFWGALTVAYTAGKGLTIAGEVSTKIKDGMIAHGELTYSTETDKVDVTLGMDQIQLFDFKQTKSIFQIKKQIPLISFLGLLGVYLDLGFDLRFAFDFNLSMKPELKLKNLSVKDWTYDEIHADIALLGQLAARLIGTPNLGVGLFALSPSILRGGGGLMMPITGEALLTPSGKFGVTYRPGGGVSGDATVGMMMTFGIKAEVKPYAELVLLDGVWQTGWTGDSLKSFEILPPKELFNFTLDFGKPPVKQEPQLPAENAATEPQPPQAAKQIKEKKGAPREAKGKKKEPVTSEPAATGDAGPFSLDSLKPMLGGLPGFAKIKGYLDKAAKAYKKLSDMLGRIFKAIRQFFGDVVDKIEEILDGFAKEGLGYLKKLVKMILGDSIYELVEPLVDAVAGSAEKLVELLETDPPKGAADFFPWALRLARKVWGIGFNGIVETAAALRTIAGKLGRSAIRFINYMVQHGMIGVKRHAYYIPIPFKPLHFLAATQFKIHVLGCDIDFKDEGMLNNPLSAAGQVLFEVFEELRVPATNTRVHAETGQLYNDRWA